MKQKGDKKRITKNPPPTQYDEHFPVTEGKIRKNKRKKFSLHTTNRNVKDFIKVASDKKVNIISEKPINEPKNWKEMPVYPVPAEKLEKHSRGENVKQYKVKDKILKQRLEKKEKKLEYSVEQAARSEALLTEEGGYLEADDYEVTTEFTQKEIAAKVDITSATKHFELKLDFGPYRFDYTNNGRHLLLGGKLGHVAAMDWVTKHLLCEINVMESCHDMKWLHIETMFATAQKDWVYIYDNQGIELHCIKQLHKILRMEFLPYHFLLATASESGHLAWLDVSIGKLIGKYQTRMGRLNQMTYNPYNATVVTGHPTGVVAIWSPMVKQPLAKILCQKTAIQAIAVDPTGKYIATSGMNRNLNIWDIRQMKPLQSYRVRGVPTSLSISHKGCLAAATGNIVEVYRECIQTTADAPYLCYKGNSGSVTQVKFCPYEDVLGIGTERGFNSILVPGCGEANFDSLEQNPYRSKSQRREVEVKALLEKVQPEFITLDPLAIMEVDIPTLHHKIEAQRQLLTMKVPKINYEPRRKNKKGGGVHAAKTKKVLQEIARKEFVSLIQKKKASGPLAAEEDDDKPGQPKSVLDRFKPKPKKKKSTV